MGFLDGLFPSAETDPSSGTSPADMQTLALGKALQQIQEVGRQRTAGPMGSIAQNLMPLFGALVQAKAAQAQAVQKGQQDRLNQILTLAKIGELNRQGGAQDPGTAEQAAVRAQLKGEPTDPWTQLQQQLHPQKLESGKPNLSNNAVTLGALQGDPTMTALRNQNQQDAQQKMMLTEQYKEQLLGVRQQQMDQKRRSVPIDGKGGYTVIDPNTEQRVVGANQGVVEDNGLIPLTRQQTTQFNTIHEVDKMLNEASALVDKVLPPKDTTMFGRANSLLGLKSQKALGTSEDIAKFTNASKFLKAMGVQALQGNPRNPPMSELQAMTDIAMDTDTQESAKAKISQLQMWLQDTKSQLLGGAQRGAGGVAGDPADFIGQLIEQGKSKEEIRAAYEKYKVANPNAGPLRFDIQ